MKSISEMTYDELLAAINKADSLPDEVRSQHADRYRALCVEAGERELAMRKFPAHQICDPELREYAGRLLRDVYALRFVDDKDFRKACWTILSDLMAICLIDPGKTLEFFGYKEVAEDDD
jgi:hypothetical protein